MATTVTIVCPGDRLRFAEEFAAGPGTYVRDQHVVAAVVGESRVVAAAEGAPDAEGVAPRAFFLAAGAVVTVGASGARRFVPTAGAPRSSGGIGCILRANFETRETHFRFKG